MSICVRCKKEIIDPDDVNKNEESDLYHVYCLLEHEQDMADPWTPQ